MTHREWIFVSEFPLRKYQCGLKAGDRVRLKKDFTVRDYSGKPTGEIHPKGEVWKVIPGSKDGRIDIWFLRPDGERCALDDDQTLIGKWFERIEKVRKVRAARSTRTATPRRARPR
jgi:hypothetical protein